MEAILARAALMEGELGRQYLANHLAMVAGGAASLQAEVATARRQVAEVEEQKRREVQELQKKLEKERAKTRMLLTRQRQRGGGDEDTITISGVSIRRGSLPSPRPPPSPPTPRPPPSPSTLATPRPPPPRSSTPPSTPGSEGRRGRGLAKKLRAAREELAGQRAEVARLQGLLARGGEGREGGVERARLAELVAVLTTRLAEAEERLAAAAEGRREEVRRSAAAETQLEKCRLQLREAAGGSRGGSRGGSGEEGRVQEEVAVLRREVEEERAGREEMARVYRRLLEDTRVACGGSLRAGSRSSKSN